MPVDNSPDGPAATRPGRPAAKGFTGRLPLNRTSMILWAVALSAMLFFIPLQILASSANQDVQGLSLQVQSIETSQAIVPTTPPQVTQLKSQLAEINGQLNQVKAVYPTLVGNRKNWPAMAGALGSYDPAQISLTAVTGGGDSAILEGRAKGDAPVLAYAQALEQSGLFASVAIQSIEITNTIYTTYTLATSTLTATPVFTPTGSATPMLTTSPTLDPRDAYEPDDPQSQPIAIGAPQQHNFYPAGDVDNSTFLAKSMHVYHVFTSGLKPGVDTVLTVKVNGMSWTDDDVKLGDLSSDVVFQNPGPDSMALVTVTNRGQYGPDMAYTLKVEELAGLPTPTGAATATATGQPTPTPTNPPVPPTNTPVPPTNTPVPPPTGTPLPPTGTPLPPTSTLVPSPTRTSTTAPSATPIWTATPSFVVTGFQVSVAPGTSSNCSDLFTFSADISVSGTGTVTYRWDRSDGSSSGVQSIVFSNATPKTQRVSDSWNVTALPGQTFNGGAHVNILSPNSFTSPQATFSLSCSGAFARTRIGAPGQAGGSDRTTLVRQWLLASGIAASTGWGTGADLLIRWNDVWAGERELTLAPAEPSPADSMPAKFVIVLGFKADSQ